MISSTEVKLLHIYASAARLDRQEYRALLVSLTGKDSSRDSEFSHDDCDRVLVSLETILFDRVFLGIVQDPRGRSRWIRAEFHFREKYSDPRRSSPRQDRMIDQLWTRLSEFIPDVSPIYLDRIITRATGHSTPRQSLTSSSAAMVIDALSDRLRWAIKHASEAPSMSETPVPF